MGGTSWSDSSYDERVVMRASTGKSTFSHSDDVRSGRASGVHATLDPSKLKAGKRECRDSAEHPESNPVYIGLDVTGSMGRVPGIVQSKLKNLMGLLLRKGYITDPSICISAIGDVEKGDKAPFQVGQFESGIEIENDLTNIYIESGGGNNNYESYDVSLYFLARCVTTDAMEKRNKKGYAFIICDESLPKRCLGNSIEKIFGSPAQDIDIKTLVDEVLQKWELFCIVPNMTSNYKSALQDSWKDVLGQRLIFLEDPETVVECIAGCIGVCEGVVDDDGLVADLTDAGLDSKKSESVSRALAKVSGTAMTKLSGTGLTAL